MPKRLLTASEPPGAEATTLVKSTRRSAMIALSFFFVGFHKGLHEVRENKLA
jgi:hypothetical protein